MHAYGKMYWLAERNQILSFEFEKDKLEWSSTRSSSSSQLFLINLRGSLALVDVFLNMKVEIYMHGCTKKTSTGRAKDYSMNLGLGRRYSTGDAYSVGAWEHGIYICNDSTF